MGYAGSQFHDGPSYLNDPLKPFGPPVATFCNEAQTVTLTCPDGTTGDPVSATVDADALCGYPTLEAANAAALAQAQAEAEALREETPCLYSNTEQQCTNTCPEGEEGDPITVTIAAGEYTSSVSQEAADDAALAAACAQADEERQSTPCGTIDFSTRIRGGEAVLCGFSEISDPSTPPKKYLNLTSSDTLHGRVYVVAEGDPLCVGEDPPDQFWVTLSGTTIYDPATCTQVAFGNRLIEQQNGGGPLPDYNEPITAVVSDVTDCFGTVVSTPTTKTVTGTDACCPEGGFPVTNQRHGGGYFQELSNEFTEGAAIAILLAGAGGTWGSWTPGTGTENVADWEQRGAGVFDFSYHPVEFRVEKAGLEPSTDYDVDVSIMRRAWGSADPFTLFSTVTVSGTTDGGGNLQIDGSVSNAIGFESYATDPVFA